MSWATQFVKLDKQKQDRASFDCGEAELNAFLKLFAAKHMEANISRTLILPTSTPQVNGKLGICSFYTVTASSISRETFPKALAKRLPYYPVPVFLIAQLAVHRQYHGTGLGKITLIKALQYLWEVNKNMPAFAIIVDCLNSNAESFYLKYGFTTLCQQHGRMRMFIPMQTVAQLFS